MGSTKTLGPKTKTITLDVPPERGIAMVAACLDVPGYVMVEMTRKGTKARVRFMRADLVSAPTS